MTLVCVRVWVLTRYDLADLYGTSKPDVSVSTNGVNSGGPGSKKRVVVHLSLCDSIPAYGPISDFTFSIAKNGVGCHSFNTLGLYQALTWFVGSSSS